MYSVYIVCDVDALSMGDGDGLPDFCLSGGFTVIVDRLVNLFTSVECCDATC